MKFIERDKDSVGAKNFLKLKPSESARGVFVGDPVHFQQHWVNNKPQACKPEGCELCKQGVKVSFRFRLNFVVNENGGLTAKVFEQGWPVYESLKALHESGYDLERYFVKITRNGSGTSTTYSIVPMPNGALTTEQLEKVAKVQLVPLGGGNQEQGFEVQNHMEEDVPPFNVDEEIPF